MKSGSIFTIEDAKEVVEAWESLEGDRHHTSRDVERWLMEKMKPAIDKLRDKIKTAS